MMCEVCGKRKAIVHFINIVNGEKKHKMLCEECALKINNISLPNENEINEELNFTKILSDLFDYINSEEDEEYDELACNFCGRKYRNFRETGFCGCPKCYEVFGKKINLLEDKKNKGKIPLSKNRVIGNKIIIKDLEEELKLLIKEENYEKAGIVRDRINELKELIIKEERENEGQWFI